MFLLICDMQVTLCAVWGVTAASFIMGLPLLQGPTAFLATTSIATMGLALCYGLPIGLHVLASERFEAGLFSLGRYGINEVMFIGSNSFKAFVKADGLTFCLAIEVFIALHA